MNLETICNGILGGLSCGIYHAVISQRQMEKHNKKIIEMQEKYLKEKINQTEKKKYLDNINE